MIPIPKKTNWHGEARSIDGAMERLLRDNPPAPPQGQPPAQGQAPDLDGFIYVPSIKLYVEKERTFKGLTWDKTQEELKNQNLMMPTPYQFREFLKFLRDSKISEYQGIFNEIVEVRDPWRAEWLNAKFENDDSGGVILVSENVLVNGKYQNKKQVLTDYLDSDKTPGISLDAWLDSNALHGLPQSKTKKGKLYYWSPVNGYVARFGAGSGRADLDCNWGPGSSYSSLGVFACAEGAVAKK